MHIFGMYYKIRKTTWLSVCSIRWSFLDSDGGNVLHGLYMPHGNTDLTLMLFVHPGTYSSGQWKDAKKQKIV